MPAREMPPSVESFLPVKPIELLILTVLADGELHGYRIRQAIVALSGGTTELEAANLYRRVRTLHADGLVEESTAQASSDDDDQRRRYFKLTALGRRVLFAESIRLRALVKYIEKMRMVAPSGGR